MYKLHSGKFKIPAQLASGRLTSMLIKTPETEDALFAIAKKSDNCIKVPRLLAVGLRNSEKSENGLDIAAASEQR